MKRDGLLSKNFESAVNEIIGSCVPMGVTVEDMDPREAQKAVKAGKFSDKLEA
jgi:large subunit ribosomal protein L11